MSALNHAIQNLEHLLRCFVRDGKQQDALKVSYELLGYQDVRDGVPRGERETNIHHAELRGLYCAARADAEALRGERDERESH